MDNKKRASTYSAIEKVEDFDLGNDSDSTLTSHGFESKRTKRTKQRRVSTLTRLILVWLRWFTVIAIQIVIVILLLRKQGQDVWSPSKTEIGADINGLYRPRSHQQSPLHLEKLKYIPNLTNDDNRMEVRRNWDMLMPLGSGAIKVPDHERYPLLGQPLESEFHTGPIFETAWTHALHCLYYIVDTYHQMGLYNGSKFGFDGERNDDHAVHCFEYLRTQLLCMADMTLEGEMTGPRGPQHVCRNMDEAVRWIENRRVDDLRSIVHAA